MQLLDFLNERSVANLQTLQWYWAPSSRRSSSKGELLRLLRRQMLDGEQVRRCFEDLEPVEQDFLKVLLRCRGYEGEVSALMAKLPTRPSAPGAAREVIEDLRRRGFIRCSAQKNWTGSERVVARMPQELGDCLAETLNLDIRSPETMLTLAGRRAESPAPQPEPMAELLALDAIAQRLASLPSEAMRRLAEVALRECGGVLPLEQFPTHGVAIEEVDGPAWRRALEGRFLGTFGHLSLLDHGLGDDHECLVIYQEVVEAFHAAAPPVEREPEHIYSCSLDFLTDLLTLVDFVRVSPSKLTSAGRFFRAARNQLAELSALHSTFFMDEDALLSLKISVARHLGLVEVGKDNRLRATAGAAAWEALSPEEQLRATLDAVLEMMAPETLGQRFFGLATVAMDLAADLPSQAWIPAESFWPRVFSRHVLEVLELGAEGSRRAATAWERQEARPTLRALFDDARVPILKALNCTGALDIGTSGSRLVFRKGEVADVAIGSGSLARASEPLLIVNPDFEVIVFPEQGHLELVHRLCGFCERGKREVTHHLKLTRESVQRGVLRGISAEEMVATLRENSRVPLSQNIEYSVRNWAASVHPARIQTLHVLEFPTAELAETAMHLPEVAPLVERRLSPNVLVLRVAELEPEAEDALKELGVHLL